MLIQISDPDVEHPTPLHDFDYVFQFKFLDIEEDSPCIDPSWRPTKMDADIIASVLKWALDRDRDVIVHCHAGICRSGAVAEVGEVLGFKYAGYGKQPNMALKRLLLESLRLGFCPEESAFALLPGPSPEPSIGLG